MRGCSELRSPSESTVCRLASRVLNYQPFVAPRTPLAVWAGGARGLIRAETHRINISHFGAPFSPRQKTRVYTAVPFGKYPARGDMRHRRVEIIEYKMCEISRAFTLSYIIFRLCVARKTKAGHSDSAGSGETKPSSAVARARVCELLSIVASGRSASATCWR